MLTFSILSKISVHLKVWKVGMDLHHCRSTHSGFPKIVQFPLQQSILFWSQVYAMNYKHTYFLKLLQHSLPVPPVKSIGYSEENLKQHTGVHSPPFLLYLLLPSPCLPLPLPFLPISPSFRTSSLNPATCLGEDCKLPQWGLGPSWNRFWCILALQSDVWWQRF